MPANNYQFIQTRKMFSEYLSGYSKDLSYYEWSMADAEDKAALLYIKFFPEITLAWCNAITSRNIVYISQDDGVSTVLQYLMKNVALISIDENRYTPNYIYTVCYRCLLSLAASRGTDQKRSLCESPNEYAEGDSVVNLFDLVPSSDDDIETQEVKDAIWSIIEHMGPKAEKVVNHLINPTDTLHKVSSKSSERELDRLADISVSIEEYEAIIKDLRVKLAPFKDILFAF